MFLVAFKIEFSEKTEFKTKKVLNARMEEKDCKTFAIEHQEEHFKETLQNQTSFF